MRRYLWLLVGLATLAGLPSHAIAQSGGTVAGTVVDASSLRPLAGVQIFVVGTQRGSLSDQQGRFSISGVPAGTQQIRAGDRDGWRKRPPRGQEAPQALIQEVPVCAR